MTTALDYPLLYRGIDWLRIGYYATAEPTNGYLDFLEQLKDIIRFKEHEERFIEIPTVYPINTGGIKPQFPEKLRFRVKTSANIYPYIAILVYEPTEIALKLGRPLKDYQIEDLNLGLTPTPNLLLNLTGTSLRPQKQFETQAVLNTLFYFLADLGLKPLAFTFSRIDYALDFPNPERALSLLLTFENLRKIKIQTDTEQITVKKSLKHLRETITELLPQTKHIGLGDPRRLLVVYYLKTDADRYLQEIYYEQNFSYGDEIPHRIEARLNTDAFRKNRKIYYIETIEEAINLDNLVNYAVQIVKEKIPQFEEYMTEDHYLFPEEHQYAFHFQNYQVLAEAEKIVRKLSLQDEALRLLSQLIRIKETWQASAKELIYTLKEMVISEHPRITKKAEEKNLTIEDLLSLIPECK